MKWRSFKYKNTCVGLISRYELIHWRSLFTEFYDVVFTQENAHCCPYPPSDEGLPSTPENTYFASGHKIRAKIVIACDAPCHDVLRFKKLHVFWRCQINCIDGVQLCYLVLEVCAIKYQSYEPVNAFLSINRHIISRFLYEPFTPTICCRFYTLLREPVKNYLADFFR